MFHNKTWTIIPSLGSLRVYVHPWSGTVSFRFIPCSRYPNSRKCVHTPRGIHSREQTHPHLGAPLPAYPYKTRVGGSRSYEVPTTRSTLPKTKRCVGSVLRQLGWAGSTRNAMLTHKTTPLPESFAGTTLRRRTTARRGFTAQGPCRGKALSQRIEDAQLRTT